MAHDHLFQKFLDKALAASPIKFWELPVPAARVAFASLAALAGAKSIPVAQVETWSIPVAGGQVSVRLYAPAAAGTTSPGLLFFHGGGFVLGTLDIYDGLCRRFSDAMGLRLISAEYRLAPEYKFPVAVEDAFTALQWVSAHAADLGLIPGRLAVGGDSAGGTLTAVICRLAREAGGPPLAGQLLIAPLTHVSENYPSMRAIQNDLILNRKAAQWFMDQYLPAGTDPDDPRVSPLMATDVRGLPPAYFVLGGADPLHDCGAAYAEKLRAAGVAVAVADYPGMMHDFLFLLGVLPQARTALQAAAAAMRTLLTA